MDIRQRIDDFEELIRTAIEANQAKMWTSSPGRIVSVDMAKQTASIQLSVKSFVGQEDGKQKAVDIPILQDVPIQFPGGGGHVMTFPVKAGDEVLVNFSSRSPDTWQQSGGDQVPPDASMHSLSNGFAMLGFRSNPNAVPNVNTNGVELRSNDGLTKVGIDKTSGVSVSTNKAVGITAAEGITVSGGSGEMVFTGVIRVVGEIILNSINLSTHKHTDVQPGSSNTGVPTN